jgi:AcrR family transcriptional regulator
MPPARKQKAIPSGRRSAGLGHPRGRVPLEHRLDDIVQAATTLFDRQGYRGTRLDDISDALGVTRAALYYYFENKERILELVCSRAMDSGEAALEAASLIADPIARLEDFIGRFGTVMTSSESKVFLRENSELATGFRGILLDRMRKVNRWVEQALQEAVDKGELRPDTDIILTTYSLLGAINWLSVWFRPGREQTASDLAKSILRLHLYGLQATKP